MNNASDRILNILQSLYAPEKALLTHSRILDMLIMVTGLSPSLGDFFSERNITLISYGDTLQHPGEIPLQTLQRFLQKRMRGLVSTVHILPFYPYSSDDGFSVIDYYAVNSELGAWDNIREISQDFRLMVDGVINHMSAESSWFKAFLAGDPEFQHLFITETPQTDLRSVTRPRMSSLLTPFKKPDGNTVYAWTTFSADQVDLDYRDPDTLIRILKVILFYIEHGAQVIRLDAIAYLWKEIGTSCIHLPQTHAVIQLIRAFLDIVAPYVVLITETNVPHSENIAYFGDGENPEAQLVYNFTLPPLLFYTLQTDDARVLSDWVNTLEAPSDQTTFLNFTASHDGIGVRPLEGLLKPEQLSQLIHKVETSGGSVSYKMNSDGTRSPYELNITYIDAITDDRELSDLQAKQFLLSQAIMLALAGVPAIYIHSLLGSRNDIDGMKRAGYPRAINRQKLKVEQLMEELENPESFRAQVFRGYIRLISARVQSPAFHPTAGQYASNFNQGKVFALERKARDSSEHLLCLFNITRSQQAVIIDSSVAVDLLTGEIHQGELSLSPYQVCWLQYKGNIVE